MAPSNQTPLPADPDSLGMLPAIALGMAAAVAVTAIAFAMSRSGVPKANLVYWVGELALYVVPTFALLFHPTTRHEGLGIAVLVPVTTYAIVQCYSPVQFRFLDEFIHLQTARTILRTHHLFHPNTLLPVSAQYPGLETVTTALSFLSHLSIYTAAAVVVGIAHVLLGVGVYLLTLDITRRPKLGGLAVVVYSTAPHFAFFDSYFLYEVIALPLLVATLLAVIRMLRAPRRSSATCWGLVAVLLAAATIVSHHATTYALIGFLICLLLTQVFMPHLRPPWPWHLPTVLCIVVILTLTWILTVATSTLSYFSNYFHPVIEDILKGPNPLRSLFGASRAGASTGLPTSSPTPEVDEATEYLGDSILLVLVSWGIVLLWHARRQARGIQLVSTAIASAGLIFLFAVRFELYNGSEIAARASSYVWIPVAISAAVALRGAILRLHGSRARHRLRPDYLRAVARFALVGSVLSMVVGGITGGWPAYFARLPGPFRVGAWERSIDQHNLLLSQWAATHLPPNYGVAADWVTGSLLSAIGDQAAPQGVAPLFLSRHVDATQVELVRRESISYVAVDLRLSRQLPGVGYYFINDPLAGRYSRPLPLADLRKFNSIPGVSLLFNDGTLQLYDVNDSLYTKGAGR